MNVGHRKPTQQHRRRRGAFAVAATMALVIAACGNDDGDEGSSNGFAGTISLGAVMPLTGGQSQRSKASIYGIEAAITEINKDGGVEVDGERYELELRTEDTRGDVTTATTAATGLIQDEDTDFIFGPVTTEEMRAVAAVTSEKPAMLLVGTATISVLGESGDVAYDNSYSYNVCGCEAYPAWVRQTKTLMPEVETAAFLFQDDPVGEFLDPVFSEAFADEGIEVVAKEFYPPNATEFTAQLTNIKEAQPDVVFFGFIPEVAGTILKQGSELDVAPMFFSPDPYSIATEGGGVDIDYLSVVNGGVYGPTATTDERQEFGQQLQDLGGGEELPVGEFTYYTAGGYAAVHLLRSAIEEVDSVDNVDAIKKAFEKAEFELPSGETYGIDPETHQARGSLSFDSTLVEPDGTVTRITFSPDGAEITGERELD